MMISVIDLLIGFCIQVVWGYKYMYIRVCCYRNYGDYKYNGDGEDYFSKKCYKGVRNICFLI